MAYRIGVAQGYAVRDGAVACDEAVRNGRMGLEAARAVTASPARRGVQGMKAAATKTASGMKATATMETASGMKATATMKTASGTKATATVESATAATVETAATAAMKTAATAMARLGYVCEREPRHCARQDRSKRQNLFARGSQHIVLHLN
jgi:hypothetical protein